MKTELEMMIEKLYEKQIRKYLAKCQNQLFLDQSSQTQTRYLKVDVKGDDVILFRVKYYYVGNSDHIVESFSISKLIETKGRYAFDVLKKRIFQNRKCVAIPQNSTTLNKYWKALFDSKNRKRKGL